MEKIFLLLSLIFTLNAKAQNNSDSAVIKLLHMGEITDIKQPVTIPIEVWGDMILIKASVNGVEVFFVWDNGFASSAIDQKIASKVNLRPAAEKIDAGGVDGNNNNVNLDLKLADNVFIGKLNVKGSAFTIIDFEKMIGPNAKPVGIIGSSIICKLNWKFDFDKNLVTISQKPFENAGVHLPFELDIYNSSGIVFGINGQMGYAQIDFGSNNADVSITLNALPFFANIPKVVTVGSLTSSVTGKAIIDTSYTIKDFAYRIGDTATYLSHQFKLNFSNSEGGLKLGNRFFRHYNCIINNTTKLIILSKRKTPINTIPEKNFGATLTLQQGKIIVNSISTNPNIKRNPQLKLMDEIVNINGKKSAAFKDYMQLRNYQMELLKNDKQMIIKRADGKVFILKPELDIYE
ncbi:hypothetical protein DBR32_15615 [Taibaiella sp. KBW10]|uniref:aspartyl protease family protein n=1 Tax=Taibaiella sp. KBW10 TaxID=2153357 RepID=UPI000F5B7DA7|nr:aspartyl protease family protein [Taibaiella sp. KBW10]RQO29683.1 hypothetical protein DBR32_15615 [Taibaiella sp. KBW10]